ncbi:BTAD domain-containing putative transcriptional regulator [Pseudofrankia inefficax]|uniref:BTAD domain-containing putative transcriptional regulator n=1 Tax=Pseudofrankia inefficax (strain DSM 45817 / CECT 9037 / DDB 130130 / EuI1c) TaxID=298654 RepID=UPI000322981F|nr:BTAD domain-containing putative transcriptional regulator [Pseudofrankia inefficax]
MAELTGRRPALPASWFRGRQEELRLAADADGARFLDCATRLLSAELAALGRPLPPVFAATLTEDALVLHLAPAPAEPPPAPWWKAAAGTWRVDRLADAPDGLSPGVAASIPPATPAPFPGLATVGFAAERARVLVDIEGAPGTIAIGGHPARARETAVSIAVELATNRWSDALRVYLVGFGDDPSVIAPGRLRTVETVEAALAELATHQRQRVNAQVSGGDWDGGQAGPVLLGRQAARTQALWTPDLLVLAEPPDEATAQVLARYAHGRDRAVGVLVVGETPAARWVFTASRDGRLSLGVLGLDVTAQRLPAQAYASIIDMFRSLDPWNEAPADALPVGGNDVGPANVARPPLAGWTVAASRANHPPASDPVVQLPTARRAAGAPSRQPPTTPGPFLLVPTAPSAPPQPPTPPAPVAPPPRAAPPEPFLPVLPEAGQTSPVPPAGRRPATPDPSSAPVAVWPLPDSSPPHASPPNSSPRTVPGAVAPATPPPTRFPRPGQPAARGPISILVPAPSQRSRPPGQDDSAVRPPPAPPAARPRPSPAGPASPLQLPWVATPAPSPPEAAWAQPPEPSAEVEIKVLGRPVVSAPGRLPADQVDELTELVVYLALNPADPPMRILAAALWPGGATDAVVADAIRRAQAWLGADPVGRPRLLLSGDGRPRLDPGVRCDWRLFTAWARRAVSRGETPGTGGQAVSATGTTADGPAADLVAALRLVSGPVLADLPDGRYGWLLASGLAERIRAAVVDVAHRLAGLSLTAGDTATAMAACRTGLRAVPTAEPLWRDLLRTVAARGDRHALQAVAAEMYRALPPAATPQRDHPAALGRRRVEAGAEPETNELVQSLLPGYRPH